MKPEEIYANLHDTVSNLLEDRADQNLVLSALAILYVALCKHQEIGADKAIKNVLSFWKDIGEEHNEIIDSTLFVEEEDIELLN